MQKVYSETEQEQNKIIGLMFNICLRIITQKTPAKIEKLHKIH